MSRIARPLSKSIAQRARVDAKSLPIAKPAQPVGSRSIGQRKDDHFFGPGGAPGGGLKDSTWLDGGDRPGKRPLLTGKNVVRGDSFAADRINRKHHGGEMKGSRNDEVSTTFRVDADNDKSTIVRTHESMGRELDKLHVQLEQLKAEVEKLKASQEKTKRPNPDGDDAPARGPVTRQELTLQRKGIKRGHSDGDDGRTDTQQSGGGGPVREQGQDDRPQREQATGALNTDRVLQIDQLVNPVRH
ncbi:MAG: hypothetical protein AB1938_22980 [Myxococcota bacterium]